MSSGQLTDGTQNGQFGSGLRDKTKYPASASIGGVMKPSSSTVVSTRHAAGPNSTDGVEKVVEAAR